LIGRCFILKNIIIAGPSRAGKSTLARKINEELNCFVVSLDKLVATFQGAYPFVNREKFTSPKMG
jgi:uridine kinase